MAMLDVQDAVVMQEDNCLSVSLSKSHLSLSDRLRKVQEVPAMMFFDQDKTLEEINLGKR